MTYGSESECATHYTTAPHNLCKVNGTSWLHLAFVQLHAACSQFQNTNVVATVLEPKYMSELQSQWKTVKSDTGVSRAAFAAILTAELPASPTWLGTLIKITMVPPDNKPCTRHKISAIRGRERSWFWRLCRHKRESERNRSWLPVDWCTMSSASSIPQAYAWIRFFKWHFLHNRDVMTLQLLQLLRSISQNVSITIILKQEVRTNAIQHIIQKVWQTDIHTHKHTNVHYYDITALVAYR